MDAKAASNWMLKKIQLDGCIYQDDVVDFLIRSNAENLVRENAEGNMVVGTELLNRFKKITESNVVWVKPDRYWRFRVEEDEPGREARG